MTQSALYFYLISMRSARIARRDGLAASIVAAHLNLAGFVRRNAMAERAVQS